MTSDASTPRPRPGTGARLMNRYAAWRGARDVRGFTSQPAPKTQGRPSRGRQFLAGNFLLAGSLVEAPGAMPWDIAAPSPAFEAALHGFGWLDDLAAVGDGRARRAAQAWTLDWSRRFGQGGGPGWSPDLAGRRQIRWIAHALFLLNGIETADSRAIFATMGRQAGFLARRHDAAPRGLPRFEALTGFVQSASALEGFGDRLRPALAALASECEREIDPTGGIASRNPEELLEIFALLTWTAAVLKETGRDPDPTLDAAIARVAPCLRSLRHSDGGLARFHGGGRGRAGLLDLALRQSGLRPAMTRGPAMGFARLDAPGVTVIADAAAPLTGDAARLSHASSLAFEMSSGGCPLIVSCGPGSHLGPEWEQAARATASHSTLAIVGYSSARLGPGHGATLAEGPRRVDQQIRVSGAATEIALSHDGWLRSHGLTHLRQLSLEADGRLLNGEDGLAALDPADRSILDRILGHLPGHALEYEIRFHLHPEVEAHVDMGGNAVSLGLNTGEVWVFRTAGDPVGMSLQPSVYLDSRHLKPRATKQIVLSARLSGYGGAVRWSLARPTDPPRRRRSRAPQLL
ncbi:heparinase [Rhodobacterales bacterium HKCCE2091]|nr:heparinase [Rhodobacterales bacterium HKCCE2091]